MQTPGRSYFRRQERGIGAFDRGFQGVVGFNQRSNILSASVRQRCWTRGRGTANDEAAVMSVVKVNGSSPYTFGSDGADRSSMPEKSATRASFAGRSRRRNPTRKISSYDQAREPNWRGIRGYLLDQRSPMDRLWTDLCADGTSALTEDLSRRSSSTQRVFLPMRWALGPSDGRGDVNRFAPQRPVSAEAEVADRFDLSRERSGLRGERRPDAGAFPGDNGTSARRVSHWPRQQSSSSVLNERLRYTSTVERLSTRSTLTRRPFLPRPAVVRA